MPPTMVPNPHDLIAYARDRIVIGEVLSVDGRNVTVRGPNNVATTVPLADILATYPRPDLADLHTTVNKLTAEAQLIHSALTAAGVTGFGTLAERVKILANDCAIYCRCNNGKAQQMNEAYEAMDKVPSIPRTGTLAEQIAALVSTHNQSHAAADKVIPETRAAVLDVRVSALVAKYLNQSDLLREAKGESERLRERNNAMLDKDDVNARNNGKAHAVLNGERSVVVGADLHDRVADLLEKYRALKAENKALREKTAWTIVDMGTLYGGKGASATPQVASGSGAAGGGTMYVWAPVGTGRSVQVPTSPPETTITVPAGANVRVVVEKP